MQKQILQSLYRVTEFAVITTTRSGIGDSGESRRRFKRRAVRKDMSEGHQGAKLRAILVVYHSDMSVQVALLLECRVTLLALKRPFVRVLHPHVLAEPVTKREGRVALVAKEVTFLAVDALNMLVQIATLRRRYLRAKIELRPRVSIGLVCSRTGPFEGR